MTFSHLKIATRLAFGFGFLLLLTILLGVIAILDMEKLAVRTEKLYNHPFTVSSAILKIDATVTKLWGLVEQRLNMQHSEAQNRALSQRQSLEQEIEWHFETLRQRFLGDQKQIEETYQSYRAWRDLIEQEVALLNDDHHARQLAQIEHTVHRRLDELEARIRRIAEVTQAKVEAHWRDANPRDDVNTAESRGDPLAVNHAILRIDANIAKLHAILERMSASEAPSGRNDHAEHEEAAASVAAIRQYQTRITQDFELALARSLDAKAEIQDAFSAFQTWNERLNEKITLLQDTERARKLAELERRQQEEMAKLNHHIHAIIDFASHKADEFLADARVLKTNTLQVMVWLILGGIVVGIAFAFVTARGIVVPLKNAVALAGALSAGDLTKRMQVTHARDETGQLLTSMNQMAAGFQTVISETSQTLAELAEGHTQLEISGEFAGDFREIQTSLQTTADQLGAATAQNDRQTWLKTGQAQLNECLGGEQDILALAKKTIDFLVTYLGARIGLLYLAKTDAANAETYLEIAASYGYTECENHIPRFHPGEGLVGQVMLERKPLARSHSPEEYTHVLQSGLTQAVPRHVLLLPFLYENQVKGVVELGACTLFSEAQREFLEQVMPAIGIAVNTAESRTQMAALLAQSQVQTEKLKTQQLEMQHTNEELQSQQEELESQQEELRQTNEALETRGREMEKQQRAVEEKNAELEKARRAMQEKAEELALASKYKSEFLANMSHELRTPLNSLLILAQLLSANKEGNLTDKQVECANTIHGSGSDLLALINEILDLSKVEAGRVEIHPEEVHFAGLIDEMRKKFQPMADDKQLHFVIEPAENLPASLYSDFQRLQQILNNLLSNAFKFTQQGGVTVRIRRPVPEETLANRLDPATSIALSVRDTGIGIPEEKQKVIFEAFQQADGTTSRRYGGTGLGLSISRQLAQLLGGDLQVRSTPGEGSEFTVVMPEKIAPSEGAQSRESSESHRPVDRSRDATPPPQIPENLPPAHADDRANLQPGEKSLLVVEDDRRFSKLLLELAREQNFQCLLAENGRDAIQLAHEYQPSAIVLDVGLPQVDGWTVMEKLKDDPETRHIPVHFVSGADSHRDAKKMGAIGYSLKPVSIGELGEAFHKIEQFISREVKKLLVVSDSEAHREKVMEILANEQVEISVAETRADALQQLKRQAHQCIMLDAALEQDTGLELLKPLRAEEGLLQIPIIVYAERELTSEEEIYLEQFNEMLTIKSVRSPERLLDETTLFLHEVQSRLPENQQKMLRMVHDKEMILKGKKVLVFDDDPRNIFALTSILENKGMEVLMAGDGEEGMEMLAENPDTAIILMDIMMPKMDGYEAMRAIRAQARYRKLPIIALTAKAMKGDRGKCIEAGASDYLAKPVDMDKLLSLMRVWLYR